MFSFPMPGFLLAISLSLVVAFLPVSSSLKAGEKCYALALSGGGDKGAYEAGVILGLVQNLPASERQWQVVTGISAGSIVGSGMAVYAIGDEEDMAKYLVGMAVNLTQADIFVEWPGGIVEGLLTKQSLFDATPLKNTLSGVLAKGIKDRTVVVGSVSLTDGSFNMWDQTYPDFMTAALSSASIPGIFQPQLIEGHLYVDGGTRYLINVFAAVDRCRALGVADQDIVVDTISCYKFGLAPPDKPPADMKTLDILSRAGQIASYGQSNKDIDEIKASYPDVTFRYDIAPSIPIPGSGIAFNHTEMEEMVVLGVLDAMNAVKGLTSPIDLTKRH